MRNDEDKTVGFPKWKPTVFYCIVFVKEQALALLIVSIVFILHLISINIIGKKYNKRYFLLLKSFQTIKFTKANPMILIISF